MPNLSIHVTRVCVDLRSRVRGQRGTRKMSQQNSQSSHLGRRERRRSNLQNLPGPVNRMLVYVSPRCYMKAQTWRCATVPGGEREDGSSGRREDGGSGEQQNGRIKAAVASRRCGQQRAAARVRRMSTTTRRAGKISISGNGRTCERTERYVAAEAEAEKRRCKDLGEF